jgi:hypothetical protein
MELMCNYREKLKPVNNLILLSLFCLFSINQVFAQGVDVTGLIIDETGEPLPGVNVVIKGTTSGVISDHNGQYSIKAEEGSILIFSYVGYVSQEIEYTGKSPVNVTLLSDPMGLDEVVIVGYGVQKKRDLTGAVSSIKLDDTPIATFSTVSHALAGKAAGLRVTQNSAQVGGGSKFRIRGETSTGAGNEPLIIIDGFPVTSTSSLGSGTR